MFWVVVFWYVVVFFKIVYDYFLLKNNGGEIFDFLNWLIGVWVVCMIGLLFLGFFIIYLLYWMFRVVFYWKVFIYLFVGFLFIVLVVDLIVMFIIYVLDN